MKTELSAQTNQVYIEANRYVLAIKENRHEVIREIYKNNSGDIEKIILNNQGVYKN